MVAQTEPHLGETDFLDLYQSGFPLDLGTEAAFCVLADEFCHVCLMGQKKPNLSPHVNIHPTLNCSTNYTMQSLL